MSVTFTPTIEGQFNGVDWVDISADVLDEVNWKRGIFGNGPLDRVAGTGRLNLALDNSISNSGALLGYYSPSHTNARSGFELGLPIRAKYVYDGNTYYPYYGLMNVANPDAGQYGERRVGVVVPDYMNIMANYKMKQIAVQATKRPDEVITTVVAALPIAPLANSYDTDPDTYTRSLHTEKDEVTAARTVAQRLAMSSYGYVFVVGDTTGGETLRWQSRHARLTDFTLTVTLTDTMNELKVIRSHDNIYNTIKAVTYPVQVREGATLYTSQREFEVKPGSPLSFIAPYTDATGAGRRITGAENTVEPVEDTHYRASAFPDGSGDDISALCGVVVTWGANSAAVTITNSFAGTMYVNLFNLVGDALLMYDPVVYETTDTTSRDAYGNKILRYDMPYQEDPNVGEDFGDYLLARHKDPVNEISGVQFVANTNATLMTAAMVTDIGERVKIVETLTGISAEYFVNGVEHTIDDNKLHLLQYYA